MGAIPHHEIVIGSCQMTRHWRTDRTKTKKCYARHTGADEGWRSHLLTVRPSTIKMTGDRRREKGDGDYRRETGEMRPETGDKNSRTRRRLSLELRNVISVHGARAVHTALGGVTGVVTASVGIMSADIEFVGVYDASRFADAVRVALAPIGVDLVAIVMIQDRMLPLA